MSWYVLVLTNNLEGNLEPLPFLPAKSLYVAREQLDFLVNVIWHLNFFSFSENSYLSQ